MPPSPGPSPDWEQCYRQGETPWDKGSPAPPLLEWMERHPGTLSGAILVPGCGFGHDVRALAEASSVESVVGIDLSPFAVEQATRQSPDVRTHFELADLFALPRAHRGAYRWVWEHTCFCAIDPARREDYVRAVHEVLEPGGQLLGVFYLDPYDDSHRPGEGPPHGCTLAELEERFVGSDRFTLVESYRPQLSYPGREGLEWVLRLARRP